MSRVLYLPAFVRDLKRLQGTREYARLRRLALTSLLCVSGVWYFRKMERTFADVI